MKNLRDVIYGWPLMHRGLHYKRPLMMMSRPKRRFMWLNVFGATKQCVDSKTMHEA